MGAVVPEQVVDGMAAVVENAKGQYFIVVLKIQQGKEYNRVAMKLAL